VTVFAAIRALTFLARDVFEAALYLIPAPGLSGDDVDGADVLAEREAKRGGVQRAYGLRPGWRICFRHKPIHATSLRFSNPDPCGSDCECPPDCHGSWDEWDDDPIADCHVPNPDDFGEPPLTD
jgi:hypothetical protein